MAFSDGVAGSVLDLAKRGPVERSNQWYKGDTKPDEASRKKDERSSQF